MDWPPGAQGSTFGGNPVCCAAALATIDLVEKQYMANAAKMGKLLLERLSDIQLAVADSAIEQVPLPFHRSIVALPLRFTALTGSSRIDDVFIDPRMR